MKRVKIALFLLLMMLGLSLPAGPLWAADAVTLIFKSGQVVKIDDGYRQIAEAMKTLNVEDRFYKIIELNIGGGSFLLNVAEVVIVCRDNCAPLTVLHQLDPKRGVAQGERG